MCIRVPDVVDWKRRSPHQAAAKGGIEMDEQSRPVEPQEGQGAEDGQATEARGAGVPAAEQTGKLRSAYLDPRGSEGTRELRDTARRRRDAEEKLQQHLMEAKHHIPNEFHEQHGHEQQDGTHQGTGQSESGTEGGTQAGETGTGEAGAGETGKDS
jgi:hypothetical protein